MHIIKGRTSRKLLQEFAELKRTCWGKHLWARGYFVASSGNITDEVVMKYIETQEIERPDPAFKVAD